MGRDADAIKKLRDEVWDEVEMIGIRVMGWFYLDISVGFCSKCPEMR